MIPDVLSGVDVLGQARTGTGKTAAFAIPILEKLGTTTEGPLPQALILVPTRELAVQVRDEISKLAKGRKTRCVAIYGGKPIRQQIDKLSRGSDIVVGTPGRVIDLLARSSLALGETGNRRARRGRPDARHRFSSRYRKNPSPLPREAANPAVERNRGPGNRTVGQAIYGRSRDHGFLA